MGAADATFERLVAEHQHEVLRVCRSILRDEHLGADAAQETFVRLWRALGEDRAPGRVGAWLGRVAVTTSLDTLRARRRQSLRDALARESSPPVEPREPAAEVEAHDLRERFERAVDRLPEGQRTIFLLRHEGERTLAQVAETLGLALPTVKTQFARACLKLQRALHRFEPEKRP